MDIKEIVAWGLGLFILIFLSLGFFFTGNKLSAFVFLIVAVLILPPTSKMLKSKLNLNLSLTVKTIIILALFLIAFFLATTEDQAYNSYNRILPASNSQIDGINFGLIEGISINEIYSIKSNDFNNVYFVGGLLSGAGVNNEIGIWATGGYESTSMIFSINGISNQFSDYSLGKGTDAEISMANDGASILEDYLKAK